MMSQDVIEHTYKCAFVGLSRERVTVFNARTWDTQSSKYVHHPKQNS